ncbi:MAG TPA: hypothetical protein VKV40_02080 [Ktedonobacteraceae bacterium]|nr:hypothetical protein [Ktedonobacteraceae bacterium]
MFEQNHREMEPSQKHFQSMILRILRSPMVWMVLAVVLTLPTLVAVTNRMVKAQSPVPADLFMQSVVKRDPNLGWHQLCSSVQSQVSLSTLTSTVQQQRRAETKEGLKLSLQYIGADARPQGGQIRVYVVTARLPTGWIGQRTYIVYTQASGCVEDVQNV